MQHSSNAAWVAQDAAFLFYSVASTYAINPPHAVIRRVNKLRVCHLAIIIVLAQHPVTHL
jgi:hypothetical protein